MKKLQFRYIVISTFVAFNISLAADPVRIENSTDSLVAEIRDALDAGFLTSDSSQYIPGYGFHLYVEKSRSLPRLDDAITELSATLDENNNDVVGLPDSEWLSIFFRASGEYDLLVRIKQNDPSSLEIWVNGTLE